jgi:hypothetical protein
MNKEKLAAAFSPTYFTHWSTSLSHAIMIPLHGSRLGSSFPGAQETASGMAWSFPLLHIAVKKKGTKRSLKFWSFGFSATFNTQWFVIGTKA